MHVYGHGPSYLSKFEKSNQSKSHGWCIAQDCRKDYFEKSDSIRLQFILVGVVILQEK